MRIILLLLFLFFSNTSFAADSFEQWLDGLKKEALSSGIDKTTIDTALDDIHPIQRVIELDRKQPETIITFQEYIKRVVPSSRVYKGRKLLKENKKLLDEISKKYGVQSRFIVALWGIETDFGSNTGSFYVPEVLATLAFDGRRSSFFRRELLNALKILDKGHISKKNMKGSWAGAMGQTQFMPSSFLTFAVDYNGDGRKDIWTSKPDLFASIANYLKKSKWDSSITWGRKIKLPENFDNSLVDIKISKKLAEWQDLGIRKLDGGNLPKRDLLASLIIPGNDEAFMVYQNYKNILKWNHSIYFATAVGILSDALEK